MSTVTLEQAWSIAVGAFQAGRWGEAESVCRQIVTVVPGYTDAWNCLGLLAMHTEAFPLAIERFSHAIAITPGNGAYHSNLSVAYLSLGQLVEAAAAARRAVTLAPGFAAAYANLGRAQELLGELDEATKALEHALSLDAGCVNAWINLGAVLGRKGDLTGAAVKYRHALALDPANAIAWGNLGGIMHLLGERSNALAALHRALALAPAHAHAHWCLAVLHLTHDEYSIGWEEFEWRWQREESRSHFLSVRRPERPLWGGENITGRTILLCVEQGYGDIFQCLRYVPLLVERGGARHYRHRTSVATYFRGYAGCGRLAGRRWSMASLRCVLPDHELAADFPHDHRNDPCDSALSDG